MNPSSPSWSDDLTIKNSESFVNRLRSMLAGNKYAFISTISSRPGQVEARVNQHLMASFRTKIGLAENIELVKYPATKDLAEHHYITIIDTYGVASLTTIYAESSSKKTSFQFTDDSFNGMSVTIEQYAGTGALLTWKFLVQGPL